MEEVETPSYVDLYHTISDSRSPSDDQSLPECVLGGIIRHDSDLEFHERSKHHPEHHADPRKRSNVGLDQIWWQQEPYVSREIYLYSVSV